MSDPSQVADPGEEPGLNKQGTQTAEQLAEVVLITTSFGGIKQKFFSSKRAQHLLDCKGLVYYHIDANKDISKATDFKDIELLDSWKAQSILKFSKNGEVVHLPQVIIDGIPIGDEKVLQDLEDDGDLDYMIARLLCPSCLSDKTADLVQCDKCKVEYRNIVPPEYVGSIRKLCQGVACE
ncbi:conserved hypothetical protein [Theileria equi strain WA]|uniref:Glutaredoxin domain-containing protein n=1 Tax=Theileria equi strain WA TaxID=1537102 RepID=L1LBP4_THEEQ|nr:conserved hypothetical protein [Theileria equi strain WA]EKX72847.1 conserved hypothetical protein [Theileria equi strain WA]|eukprot:XP_004832299.1 conserved hypothetical protein [Theileria equi strain WA]